MSPDILIEAFLFYKAGPVRKADLAAATGLAEEALPEHLATLRTRLESGATALVETDKDVQITTNAAVAPFIDAVRKDELRADIGKAGAETLAIILYKEPVTRAEIDRIRGVNSSVTIRNLLTRGLITRTAKQGSSGATFSTTPQLLAHLGIERKHELPDHGTILDRIEAFEATYAETE